MFDVRKDRLKHFIHLGVLRVFVIKNLSDDGGHTQWSAAATPIFIGMAMTKNLWPAGYSCRPGSRTPDIFREEYLMALEERRLTVVDTRCVEPNCLVDRLVVSQRAASGLRPGK